MRAARIAAMCLAVVASAGVLAVPAMAERLPEEGPGQPPASGNLSQEPRHGVIHCQTAAELFIPGSTNQESSGAIVIKKNGTHLAAPEGGDCELIYKALFGG